MTPPHRLGNRLSTSLAAVKNRLLDGSQHVDYAGSPLETARRVMLTVRMPSASVHDMDSPNRYERVSAGDVEEVS